MAQPLWGPPDIPDLHAKTALVTGANSGIGLETALELAAHGATVLLACRNPHKAQEALAHIQALAPGATLEVVPLDLASLASVRRAAETVAAGHQRLDLVVNNAGIMGTPARTSQDGYELQFATNHLGHFALTGLLLPGLLAAPGARVVTVTSLLHRIGHLSETDDPAHPRHYRRWSAYGTSKLANLLFTHELERRFERAGAGAVAVSAHPGWTRSNLAANGPVLGRPALWRKAGAMAGRHLGQSTNIGALPVLRAATAPDVRGGECYGPGGAFQAAGSPVRVDTSPASYRRDLAASLWSLSERLTGVDYPLGGLQG